MWPFAASPPENFISPIRRPLKLALEECDAVVIGARAGLSTSTGLAYSGERFEKNLGDFKEKYSIRDMYSGGFYPFKSLGEYWAWWSRHIMVNRYERAPQPVYDDLRKLVEGKNYFVLTTNVDHQFKLMGFDKKRLFYTQGDTACGNAPSRAVSISMTTKKLCARCGQNSRT